MRSCVMLNESDVRAALDELAQALSVIAPLSAVLRQTLTTQADEAVMLEATVGAWRAHVRVWDGGVSKPHTCGLGPCLNGSNLVLPGWHLTCGPSVGMPAAAPPGAASSSVVRLNQQR